MIRYYAIHSGFQDFLQGNNIVHSPCKHLLAKFVHGSHKILIHHAVVRGGNFTSGQSANNIHPLSTGSLRLIEHHVSCPHAGAELDGLADLRVRLRPRLTTWATIYSLDCLDDICTKTLLSSRRPGLVVYCDEFDVAVQSGLQGVLEVRHPVACPGLCAHHRIRRVVSNVCRVEPKQAGKVSPVAGDQDIVGGSRNISTHCAPVIGTRLMAATVLGCWPVRVSPPCAHTMGATSLAQNPLEGPHV
mmetsp:Transcript_12011/g.16298  ORF Transcript_12011/g.16298 Transcript_12011/m.16298 type:complete len:245 (+) Transcript_12011:127-861(+)